VRRILAALALLVLTLPAVAAQEAIYVVRHTERLDQTADPPLSPAGHARALGVAPSITIPDAEHDNLFIVVPRKDAAPTFVRVRY
jgi:hypothetical protein